MTRTGVVLAPFGRGLRVRGSRRPVPLGPRRRHLYPASVGELAGKAAAIAERVHAILSDRFASAPAGRVQLLLSDHADISNGYASASPTTGSPSSPVLQWTAAASPTLTTGSSW